MKKVIIGYNNNEQFLIKEKSQNDKKISEILETVKEREEKQENELDIFNGLMKCTSSASPIIEKNSI